MVRRSPLVLVLVRSAVCVLSKQLALAREPVSLLGGQCGDTEVRACVCRWMTAGARTTTTSSSARSCRCWPSRGSSQTWWSSSCNPAAGPPRTAAGPGAGADALSPPGRRYVQESALDGRLVAVPAQREKSPLSRAGLPRLRLVPPPQRLTSREGKVPRRGRPKLPGQNLAKSPAQLATRRAPGEARFNEVRSLDAVINLGERTCPDFYDGIVDCGTCYELQL